jgi:hypothetical protein
VVTFIRKHVWFLLLALACSAYAAWNLNRGWVEHDDGALAQSAERVLHGEMPHRDFDEIYSGLLDYIHAGAFALFGTRLLSLRFPLFFFFLCWLPCFYVIVLRFVRPVAAALIMALAAVWTIPLYPASMPSWYNLFFATFSYWFLLRFIETGKRSWIFAAGLCCGLSVLIKISGIYALAAALLTLVHYEQVNASPRATRLRWPGWYAAFEIISLAAFPIAILRILGGHISAPYLYSFLLPSAIIAVYLIARTLCADSPLSDLDRFRALFSTVLALALGSLLLPALYLLAYFSRGATHALYEGIMDAPTRRLDITTLSPGAPSSSWSALVLLATIVLAMYMRERAWRTCGFFVCAVYLFFQSAHHPLTYQPIWNSFAYLLPYATAAILAFLLWGKRDIAAREQTMAFAALAFAVCCNLIRFPFDGPIYTAYVLPLVILAIIAATGLTPRRSAGMAVVLIVFFSAFAIFRARSSFIVEMSSHFVHDYLKTPLGLDRGREILTDEGGAKQYRRLIKLVLDHSHSEYIYAGPDAPDVYFLSGKKNPTRTMFDFLDARAEQQAMEALRRRPIEVAVIRKRPQFSPPLDRRLETYIEIKFPNAEQVGRFEVRWK